LSRVEPRALALAHAESRAGGARRQRPQGTGARRTSSEVRQAAKKDNAPSNLESASSDEASAPRFRTIGSSAASRNCEVGMASTHIFQILNHYTSQRELDPGFGVIDNSANERPDWFEYWPIRKFLLNQVLDENAFYGFLSPKFQSKTNLTAAQVLEFIRRCDSATEVILFSPSIHTGAQFLNVFEHGDAEHPGLLATSRKLLKRLNRPIDLDELITDSRNTVHSNYFVARPRFWREWLAINEQLFAIAEAAQDALGEALTSYTSYRGRAEVQMKIFVMERVATLILASDASFVTRVRNPFVARKRIYKLPLAIVGDALKIAYRTQGFSQYKDVFLLMRSMRKFWNFQIRFGTWLGVPGVRRYTHALASYWEKKEQ
jgi:hypothetical protein